ncbi:hypothetical protein DIU36_04795 [Mucilaginibacter rubeus]|nr:hypothetical protein DIU36_04795 [Mucilaginibacter rubeus]
MLPLNEVEGREKLPPEGREKLPPPPPDGLEPPPPPPPPPPREPPPRCASALNARDKLNKPPKAIVNRFLYVLFMMKDFLTDQHGIFC